jgi:hypothetical protein
MDNANKFNNCIMIRIRTSLRARMYICVFGVFTLSLRRANHTSKASYRNLWIRFRKNQENGMPLIALFGRTVQKEAISCKTNQCSVADALSLINSWKKYYPSTGVYYVYQHQSREIRFYKLQVLLSKSELQFNYDLQKKSSKTSHLHES